MQLSIGDLIYDKTTGEKFKIESNWDASRYAYFFDLRPAKDYEIWTKEMRVKKILAVHES